jgi:hypothetical protein
MRSQRSGRLLVVGVIVGLMMAWPATGRAQEAIISGTVTDATGGVLPGVTVVAVHEATGNIFEGVTEVSGNYQIPLYRRHRARRGSKAWDREARWTRSAGHSSSR